MILYNFFELVTSHTVVKTSKNTKHVYKINFAIAVNICIMDYAVRGDFGAAAIDYRGIVKAAGK